MIYQGTLSRKKEIAVHLAFWLLLVYFKRIQFDAGNTYYFSLAPVSLFSVTWIIVFMSTFYFNYIIVLPRVFNPFQWKNACLGIGVAYLFFVGLRFFLEQYLAIFFFGRQNYSAGFSIAYYFYDNLFYSSRVMIISTIFWLIVFLIRLLEYNKFIIEEQKNTEIKFLKAQINPHFVFNTLNNIYSMVYFQSSKSLSAIEKLSSIMRFTTYESQKEKIKLTEELDYIKAYIELEQLRHQEDAFVKTDINLNDIEISIPPYILSPLVENALKHGVASTNKPIQVVLALDKNALRFTVKNEISNHKKDKLGGIGLENLKKRLEIYYPKSHILRLTNENTMFTAYLEIQLK